MRNSIVIVAVLCAWAVFGHRDDDHDGDALVGASNADPYPVFNTTEQNMTAMCVNGSVAYNPFAATVFVNETYVCGPNAQQNGTGPATRCPYGTCCSEFGVCGPDPFANTTNATDDADSAMQFCSANLGDYRFINCSSPDAIQVIPYVNATTSATASVPPPPKPTSYPTMGGGAPPSSIWPTIVPTLTMQSPKPGPPGPTTTAPATRAGPGQPGGGPAATTTTTTKAGGPPPPSPSASLKPSPPAPTAMTPATRAGPGGPAAPTTTTTKAGGPAPPPRSPSAPPMPPTGTTTTTPAAMAGSSSSSQSGSPAVAQSSGSMTSPSGTSAAAAP